MADYTPKIIWADGTETAYQTIKAGADWVADATRDVLDITLADLTPAQARELGKDSGRVGDIPLVTYVETPSSVNVPPVITEQRSAYNGYNIYAGVYDDAAGGVHLKLACELVQREKQLMDQVDTLTDQNAALQETVDAFVLAALEGGDTK